MVKYFLMVLMVLFLVWAVIEVYTSGNKLFSGKDVGYG